MSDLVKTLRDCARRKHENRKANSMGHPNVRFIEEDAADKIEELESDAERTNAGILELTKELAKLRAQVEALKTFADLHRWHFGQFPYDEFIKTLEAGGE